MGHGHMGRSVEFARGHVNDVPSLVYTVLRSFGGHEKPRDQDCVCVFLILVVSVLYYGLLGTRCIVETTSSMMFCVSQYHVFFSVVVRK